jgi:hypothetical protein
MPTENEYKQQAIQEAKNQGYLYADVDPAIVMHVLETWLHDMGSQTRDNKKDRKALVKALKQSKKENEGQKRRHRCLHGW